MELKVLLEHRVLRVPFWYRALLGSTGDPGSNGLAGPIGHKVILVLMVYRVQLGKMVMTDLRKKSQGHFGTTGPTGSPGPTGSTGPQ